MTYFNEELLQEIAEIIHTAVEIIRAEMKKAIDFAFRNEDFQARRNFIRLFDNKKPTIEEFLIKITMKVKNEDGC